MAAFLDLNNLSGLQAIVRRRQQAGRADAEVECIMDEYVLPGQASLMSDGFKVVWTRMGSKGEWDKHASPLIEPNKIQRPKAHWNTTGCHDGGN